MKSFLFNLAITIVFTSSIFSQETEIRNYETFDLFLTEQNEKAAQIELGQTEEEVRTIFGNTVRVKVPKVGKMKPLDHVFKQPEFKNIFKPRTEGQITVLWYFTTPKDQSGVISKRECTPVMIVKDSVYAIGWEAFNKARMDGSLRR